MGDTTATEWRPYMLQEDGRMPWLQIDDAFVTSPRVTQAAVAAASRRAPKLQGAARERAARGACIAVWVEGLTHALRHDTDGHLARADVELFLTAADPLAAAAALVAAELWDEADGGFRIRGYLDFYPSAARRAEMRAARAAKRDTGSTRARASRARDRAQTSRTPARSETETKTGGAPSADDGPGKVEPRGRTVGAAAGGSTDRREAVEQVIPDAGLTPLDPEAEKARLEELRQQQQLLDPGHTPPKPPSAEEVEEIERRLDQQTPTAEPPAAHGCPHCGDTGADGQTCRRCGSSLLPDDHTFRPSADFNAAGDP